MNYTEATSKYLDWLKQRVTPNEDLFKQQIEEKNTKMKIGAFPFLRGTFYRWAEHWPAVCGELAKRKQDVFMVIGDIHMENYGTWRDTQGRLVWGINDFDEVHEMAFTSDLVRLVTSALAAAADNQVKVASSEAASSALEGYQKGCDKGARPFILESGHDALRCLIDDALADRDATKFWAKLNDTTTGDYSKPTPSLPVPAAVQKLLKEALPAETEAIDFRVVKKAKGLGSLGRPRYLALGSWQGGYVAREAKRLAPSAVEWVADPKSDRILAGDLAGLGTPSRSPDATYQIKGEWVVRGLRPDAVKVELTALDPKADKREAILGLLKAMGRETANIHLGRMKAAKLTASLEQLGKANPTWLKDAAKAMWQATQEDHEEFLKSP